jgi:hypothetical protein
MPEPRPRRNGATPPTSRGASPHHAPREPDLDTQVQEELSAEVVALSDAVLALLRDRGHVAASDLTEEVILEATEMILFAAMHCAHAVLDSVRRARSEEGRRHYPAAANGCRVVT